MPSAASHELLLTTLSYLRCFSYFSYLVYFLKPKVIGSTRWVYSEMLSGFAWLICMTQQCWEWGGLDWEFALWLANREWRNIEYMNGQKSDIKLHQSYHQTILWLCFLRLTMAHFCGDTVMSYVFGET